MIRQCYHYYTVVLIISLATNGHFWLTFLLSHSQYDKQRDGSIIFAYEFAHQGDAAFGYSYYDREIKTSALCKL